MFSNAWTGQYVQAVEWTKYGHSNFTPHNIG